MVTRVNGGLITDQMLTGSLRHFKMAGTFNYVVSDGTVTLASTVTGGEAPTTSYFLVGDGRPVPGSLAELAIRQVMEKCNVVEMGLVGTPGTETEVHFSVSATACAWEDAAEIQAAIALLGATVTVPTTSGGAAGDNSSAPATAVVNATTITVTEVPFVLA